MGASNLILIGREIERRDEFSQILLAHGFEISRVCEDLSGLLAYDVTTCPALCVLVVDVEELVLQLDELAAARRLHPEIRIVIISQDLPQAVYRDVVRAGVNGIFRTDVSGDILGHSLRLILLGLRLLSARSMVVPTDRMRRRSTDIPIATETDRLATRLPGEPAVDAGPAVTRADETVSRTPQDPSIMLSGRELQVLHCLADGLSNKAIARNLSLAEATVKAYVKTLLRKIRVSNRTQAAIWAVNNRDAMKSTPGDVETVVEIPMQDTTADPEELGASGVQPDYASMIRITASPILAFDSRGSGSVIRLHGPRHVPGDDRTGLTLPGRKTAP